MKSEIYIPREDSFFLAQILEKELPKILTKNLNLTLLEIGSGSGIQLEIALKLKIKKNNIFSCDINPLSVRYCKNLGFNCIQSSLFEEFEKKVKIKIVESFKIPYKFDVIIFNPPYLPEDFSEPKSSRVATTGGKLGSEIINRFLRQAKPHLNKNAKIFLLTSSHSKKINFLDYNKKIIAKRKLFFEELYIWELRFRYE